MRGAAVVVGIRFVTVVRVRAVGEGVAVAVAEPVPSAVGWSGAAAFWMCDAANALTPVNVVNVTPVTSARSAYLERMSEGFFDDRSFMVIGDHAGAAGA